MLQPNLRKSIQNLVGQEIMKIIRDGSSEDHVVWGVVSFSCHTVTYSSHHKGHDMSQEFMRLLGHGESRVFPVGRPANLAA